MSNLQRLGLLNREGMKACNEGRHDDALFQLKQADSLAQLMESPLHEAKVRNNIGLVHQMAGNVEDALTSFRLAKRHAIKGAGEGNVLDQIITRNLARLEKAVEDKAA